MDVPGLPTDSTQPAGRWCGLWLWHLLVPWGSPSESSPAHLHDRFWVSCAWARQLQLQPRLAPWGTLGGCSPAQPPGSTQQALGNRCSGPGTLLRLGKRYPACLQLGSLWHCRGPSQEHRPKCSEPKLVNAHQGLHSSH